MKKILFLLLCLLSAIQTYGQCDNLPYKPLSEFNNDTTAFVMYNFRDRGDCYAGKTFETFVQDLKIPIKYFILSVDEQNTDNVIGLSLFIYEEKENGRRNHFKIETNAVRIYLEEPINRKVTFDLAEKHGEKGWNKKLYKAFRKMKLKCTRSLIYEYSKYKERYKNEIEYI